MAKVVYCKCYNEYILEKKCDCGREQSYWKQGVGVTAGYKDYEYLLTEGADRIIAEVGDNIII